MKARNALPLSLLVACAWPLVAGAQEKAPDDEATRIQSYCFGPNASMAEGRVCFDKQEARIKRQFDAAVRQKLFAIGEIAKRSEDDGPPNGRETADRARASFNKEQAAWVTYSIALCRALSDFGTGTAGAEDDAALCRVRAILRRIADLKH
ncbi:lysozyme inhibitor LprI family protein [Methylobacterium terrae]|nr:lysozyme inhibitor LprI family protein [Methylobacterium terrae]